MSDRIDDILRVLDNATQSSTEHGFAFQPPPELCWRCDCKIDNDSPTELCSKCIEEMRAEKPAPMSFGDQITAAVLELLRENNRRFLAQAFRMGEPVLVVDDEGRIVGAIPDFDPTRFATPHGQCLMNAEDECSTLYCCERCPYRFVLIDDLGHPIGFDGPTPQELDRTRSDRI